MWIRSAVVVAISSVVLCACGSGAAGTAVRSADDFARLAAQQFKGRSSLTTWSEGQITQRTRQALGPVADLNDEEMGTVVDIACTAYDLSNTAGKAQAENYIRQNAADDQMRVKRLMANLEALDTAGNIGSFVVCDLDI